MRIENDERDMMFWTRQVLNIIFMLAAIIGVICYVWGDKRTGIFVVLGAMVVKMAESTLRMLKK
ncbi:MAG: hypothetical protein IKQ05_03805 [Prevotella sp.]|jgi:hypothetical protein|nr:hypothetical protein [Prevotella sp.]